MTTKQLRSLGSKWVERLRLEDWDITFRFAVKDECTTTWGWCENNSHDKTATIIMLKPTDPSWLKHKNPKDFESVLVHELLHLHFAPLDHQANSIQHTIEENIVNQVGRLLVALDRHDESLMNGGKPLSKNAAIKSK